MNEQATAAKEITAAASDLEEQTKQANRAMTEQTLGFRQITGSSANIAKQIKLIASANLDNSQSTRVILERLQEVRDVSRENAESAKNIERVVGKRSETMVSLKRRNGRRKPASAPVEGGESA
jgi:methyl-accepting chemotaxis protein